LCFLPFETNQGTTSRSTRALAAGAQNVHHAVHDVRMSVRRLPPPRLAGGISGSTYAHSSSIRSLGYLISSDRANRDAADARAIARPSACSAVAERVGSHVQSSMSRMQGSPAPPLQASSYSRIVQVLPTPAPKKQGIGGGNICHVQRRSTFSAARGPAYTRSRQTPPVTFFRRGYTLGYIGGLSDV
jgi:hypothetical protein